jgi:acyl-CoA hydrolase
MRLARCSDPLDVGKETGSSNDTLMTFVKIDEQGEPVAIAPKVKEQIA